MATKTPELSITTIDELLEGAELPDNFDKLSARKQKEIIFNTVLTTYKQLAETLQYKYKAEETKKLLQRKIKNLPESKKLTQLTKQLKEAKTEEMILLERYEGMKILAVALGFDQKLLSQISSVGNNGNGRGN